MVKIYEIVTVLRDNDGKPDKFTVEADVVEVDSSIGQTYFYKSNDLQSAVANNVLSYYKRIS